MNDDTLFPLPVTPPNRLFLARLALDAAEADFTVAEIAAEELGTSMIPARRALALARNELHAAEVEALGRR